MSADLELKQPAPKTKRVRTPKTEVPASSPVVQATSATCSMPHHRLAGLDWDRAPAYGMGSQPLCGVCHPNPLEMT